MSQRPNDLDLLRAVYRRLDRSALRADLPGLTEDEILAFFRRLSGFVKTENGGPATGDGGPGRKATAATKGAEYRASEGGCATPETENGVPRTGDGGPGRNATVVAGGGVKKGVLHADGGSRGNPGLSGYGAVLLDEKGGTLAEKGECIGEATNNEAEYRGLIAGLRMALDHGITEIEIRMDSDLVVQQIKGNWKVRARHLVPLIAEAQTLLQRFTNWHARHIPRELNARADLLANDAMDRGAR